MKASEKFGVTMKSSTQLSKYTYLAVDLMILSFEIIFKILIK